MVKTTIHLGKPIVEIDFGPCTPGNFAPIIADAQRIIRAERPGSVLALTRVERVRFDAASLVELQRFASACMPHLKGNAIIGIDGMKKVVFGAIRTVYKVPLELFDEVAPARDWLARL
jgi:hypothetical protein